MGRGVWWGVFVCSLGFVSLVRVGVGMGGAAGCACGFGSIVKH